MINEGIKICDYQIKGGVFQCQVKIDSGLEGFQSVKWKEVRTGLESASSLEYQWEDEKDGRLIVHTDFLDGDYSIRTWRLVFVYHDGGERTAFYYEEQEERNWGKMLSLSKTEVVAERNIHLIPAIDKDGAFAIRKWRTSSITIKTNPAYAECIHRYGTSVEVELLNPYKKEIREAEVFIWSKSCKRLLRIPISVKAAKEGRFSFDIRRLIEKNGDALHRLWEIYLVMNLEGTYYLSRIEDKENWVVEQKKKEALKKNKKYKVPHKHKKMDENDRFFGGIPYTSRREGGYRIETERVHSTERLFMLYYTEEMQLACKFTPRRYFYVTQLRERLLDITILDGICTITTLNQHKDFKYHDLVIRYRKQESPIGTVPEENMEEEHFELTSEKSTRKGVLQIWTLDFNGIGFKQYYWDLFLIGKRDGYDYEVRPINPDGRRFQRKLYKGHGNEYLDSNGQIIFPYQTERENVLLFCRQKNPYDEKTYVWKERWAIFFYHCFKWFYDRKKRILMYEKHCKMAQDNSYAMFRYLTSENAMKKIRKNTYYIIDKSQPDYEKLKGYGNKIVDFMSVRHLIYLQAAGLFVSIDSKRHAYPWRSRNSKVLDVIRDKPFLFLQHGVIGLKRVDYIYKKDGINGADHIIVSSEYEKGITMRWFGYEENDVIIAGMARWDKVEDRSKDSKEILLMPTWRNWLQEVTDEVFLQSDYYQHYSELLADKGLLDFLEKNDLYLIYCMHPKFREFMKNYQVKSDRIRLFTYETKPIMDLIMDCRMLVTDYSSVSWDFHYLKKPIIFYQFDYNKYMEHQGSYYDMEKDLFGPRAMNKEELLSELYKCHENGFQEEERYKRIRRERLPDKSVSICKTIYDEIVKRYYK